ncbi:hypothetical protein AVEN_259183-1 [Araneus ventricosus]|uniref:Uncharacterized protein n=1 Tax=Araneus ventricosus TaxID=182803 RepID=A0A4Y2GCC4_ARAVE|nr:hypothetical protein AVEN_259183-1 [Araneus ventricosus]
MKKPAGVVYPKLSCILLEKGAVSPPPAWIKKFEPIVTQDPMTIRKYLSKKSNSKRCVPIKCIPNSTLSSLKDNPSACTDCYQVRMRMEKSSKQESINIVHRRLRPIRMRVETADALEMRLYGPTDSQPFDGFGPKFYTDLHS